MMLKGKTSHASRLGWLGKGNVISWEVDPSGKRLTQKLGMDEVWESKRQAPEQMPNAKHKTNAKTNWTFWFCNRLLQVSSLVPLSFVLLQLLLLAERVSNMGATGQGHVK